MNPFPLRENETALAKLKRIEQLKRENRKLKQQAGLCEKCGCNLCDGCDYDHDCFEAERQAGIETT